MLGTAKVNFVKTFTLSLHQAGFHLRSLNLTQILEYPTIKISAHDLEIEYGRYKNTHRVDRTCAWCQSCMGINIVEDESHVLFHCDPDSLYRLKSISNSNKALLIATDNDAEPTVHIT